MSNENSSSNLLEFLRRRDVKLSSSVAVPSRPAPPVPIQDFDMNAANRQKFYNQLGIQSVKGGQTIDTGFAESLIKSYTNLTNQPATLILLIFLALMVFAEYHNKEGPLESLAEFTKNAVATSTGWEKTAAVLVNRLVQFLVKNKTYFMKFGFVWLTVLAKPSTNNIIVSTLLSFVVLIVRSLDVLTVAEIAQLHFLFTSVRNPAHKMLVLCIVVVVYFFSFRVAEEAAAGDSVSPPSGPNPPSSGAVPPRTKRAMYNPAFPPPQ